MRMKIICAVCLLAGLAMAGEGMRRSKPAPKADALSSAAASNLVAQAKAANSVPQLRAVVIELAKALEAKAE